MALRAGREPLRRGEAPLREADPHLRPGVPRPRALHPLRSLHPLRQGGGGRPAHPLPGPGLLHAGQHVPGRAVQLVLLGQHRADLPGRGADRVGLPLPGPPLGPRRGRVDLPGLLVRLLGHAAVVAQPAAAHERRRQRRRELELAVRPRPLRLRGHQQRGAAGRTAAPRGRHAHAGALGRRHAGRLAGRQRGGGRPRARLGGGAGRRPARQREPVRLGQAGQGHHRHRPRRRPAGRRPAGRLPALPAPRHDRRRPARPRARSSSWARTPRRRSASSTCASATPSWKTAPG